MENRSWKTACKKLTASLLSVLLLWGSFGSLPAIAAPLDEPSSSVSEAESASSGAPVNPVSQEEASSTASEPGAALPDGLSSATASSGSLSSEKPSPAAPDTGDVDGMASPPLLQNASPRAGGADKTDDAAAITRTLSLSYETADGQIVPLADGANIADIGKVDHFILSSTLALPDESNPDDGSALRKVTAGDFYRIALPEDVIFPDGGASISIVEGNVPNREIALLTFVPAGGGAPPQAVVTFSALVDDPNVWNIEGEFHFNFTLDSTGWANGETKTITIPIAPGDDITITVTKPLPPATKPESITKEGAYDKTKEEIRWTVSLKDSDKKKWDGYTVTDTIDTTTMELLGVEYDGAALSPSDYSYDPGTGDFSYEIPAGADTAPLTLVTRVLPGVYTDTSGNKTTIKNRAGLEGPGLDVPLQSDEASKDVPHDWLQKKGTALGGNRIKWTLTVNTSEMPLLTAYVTDVFTADLTLDESTILVDGTAPSGTPSGDDAYYTYNNVTREFVYHYAKGNANALRTKSTLTFETTVKPHNPDDPTDNLPYKNSAKLNASYLDGDGNGHALATPQIESEGVGLPRVNITKTPETLTAADKSAGTITWKINAVSNLSAYGPTRIVDTLPDDQEYVPGEVYLGSVAPGNKLTSATTPSAAYSGNTLTIDFLGDEALDTAQNIYVVSKIKPENYGKNLSAKQFTNKADVTLYKQGEPIGVDANKVAQDFNTGTVNITNTVLGKTASAYSAYDQNPEKNPRVNFKISVNANHMPLTDVKVADDLNNLATEFKLAGTTKWEAVDGVKWTLVPGSVVIAKKSGTDADPDLARIAAAAEAAYTKEANVLSLDLGAIGNAYDITFTAELDATEKQKETFHQNGGLRCRNNQAEITGTGLNGTIAVTANPSSEITNQILGKDGKFDNDSKQLIWTIQLNQKQLTLKNNEVLDPMPKGLTFDPTSIRLYENVIQKDGSFVKADKLTADATVVPSAAYTVSYGPAESPAYEGQQMLSVKLPDDSTAYVLQFATDVDPGVNGKVNNTAYYRGQGGDKPVSDGGEADIGSGAGGSSTTKGWTTVSKLDSGSGANLPGAVFELNWIRDGKPVFVRRLTTGADGKAIFRGLSVGESYSVTEVGAPGGYQIDDPNPRVFPVGSAAEVASATLVFKDTPEKTGSVTPAAVKTLVGKDQTAGQFSFALKDSAGKTVMLGTTGTPAADKSAPVAFTPASGVTNPLTYKNAHLFAAGETEYLVSTETYTMEELPDESLTGYTFDDTVHTLTVKVWNVKASADLKVVVYDKDGNALTGDDGTFPAGKAPAFQNSYTPTGKLELTLKKELTGRALEEGQFQFTLTEEGGSGAVRTAVNKADGTVPFEALLYKKADIGTHTYTVRETDAAKPGYAYDGASYKITAQVADGGDGRLTVAADAVKSVPGAPDEPVGLDALSFRNTYTASDTTAQIAGSKTLTGHAMSKDQFRFTLSELTDADPDGKDLETVKNSADGSFAFSPFTYTQNDMGKSFRYLVREENDGQKGYTYDSAQSLVTVKVLDNGDGTMKTEQTFVRRQAGEAGSAASAVAFQNQYTAAGKTTVNAVMRVQGKPLLGGQFHYELQPLDKNGKPAGDPIPGENTETGEITFPDLDFTTEDIGKTFPYELRQTKTPGGGYEPDGSVYLVEITVKDNGDGTLTVEQTMNRLTPDGKKEPVGDMTFDNTFTPPESSSSEVSSASQPVSSGTSSQSSSSKGETSPPTGDPGSGSALLLLAVSGMAAAGLLFLKRGKTKPE